MKKSLDFSIRYGKADGWMLKLCLLCLICLGGSNISLQAKTEGNEAVKMLEETSQQQKELLIRGFRSIVTYSIATSRRPVCFADVWLGTKESIPLVTYSDVKISIPKNEVRNLKVFASYKSPIKAPIKKGDYVADLIVECGNLKYSYELHAGEDVQELDVFNRAMAALKFMIFGRSAH
jgi:D-alanyl-D-alanine carboxypeptidase (penicillin-binding protein 5/6)